MKVILSILLLLLCYAGRLLWSEGTGMVEEGTTGRSLRTRRSFPTIQLTPVNDELSRNSYQQKIKKLKENGKFEAFQEEERLRNSLYRLNLDGEALERYRHKAKLRMRRYRQRKKEKQQSENNAEKPLTRSEQERIEKEKSKLREYNRIKKQESRARYSAQKKRRVKEADRKYRTEKRLDENNTASTTIKEKPTRSNVTGLVELTENDVELTENDVELTESNTSPKDGFISSASKRKALSRSKRAMPKDSVKWVETIKEMINGASPTKKRLLSEAGLYNTDSLSNTVTKNISSKLKKLKKKRDKESQKMRNAFISCIPRKYRKMRSIKRSLDLENCSLLNMNRKQKVKSIKRNHVSEAEKKLIAELYEEYSVVLPCRKSISKKTLKQKSICTRTVRVLYDLYLKKSKRKVSLSVFSALRPSHILPVFKTTYNQCLCEKCTNVDLKLQVLNQICPELKLSDRFDCVNKTLCTESSITENQEKCIERNCEDCGIRRLEEHYSKAKVPADKILTWKEWGTATFKVGEKIVTRKSQIQKRGYLKDILEELYEEVNSLAKHLFISSWQYNQAKTLKTNLPKDSLLIEADFSENYRCEYQDEIQSAHWSYNQVTVHPLVCHYHCPQDECDQLVRESVVILSDDLHHDASAVDTFLKETCRHLKEDRGICLKKIYQFTDGCSAQYKSKEPFSDISMGINGVLTERSFYGSNHGKGPCDGLGAVTKQATRLAVKSRNAIIRNATDMYNYLKENMTIDEDKSTGGNCQHTLRIFMLINSINHNRFKPAKSLPGTRALHNIRGIKPGQVQFRNLSCYCSNCLQNKECVNSTVVGQWKEWKFDIPFGLESPTDDTVSEMLEDLGLAGTISDDSFTLDILAAEMFEKELFNLNEEVQHNNKELDWMVVPGEKSESNQQDECSTREKLQDNNEQDGEKLQDNNEQDGEKLQDKSEQDGNNMGVKPQDNQQDGSNTREKPQDNDQQDRKNTREKPQDNDQQDRKNTREKPQDNDQQDRKNTREKPQDNDQQDRKNTREKPQDNDQQDGNNTREKRQDNDQQDGNNTREKPQDNDQQDGKNMREKPQDNDQQDGKNTREKPQDNDQQDGNNTREKPQDNDQQDGKNTREKPQDNDQQDRKNTREKQQDNNQQDGKNTREKPQDNDQQDHNNTREKPQDNNQQDGKNTEEKLESNQKKEAKLEANQEQDDYNTREKLGEQDGHNAREKPEINQQDGKSDTYKQQDGKSDTYQQQDGNNTDQNVKKINQR